MIIADGLSGMAGMDWTPFAQLIGLMLAAVAIASGVPAALTIIAERKAQAAGETASVGRRIARWTGIGVMVVIASSSGTAAGWMFWSSHRGDFRPYADVRAAARPGCRDQAVRQGLKGAARSEHVRWCVNQAVAAADDD